MRFIHLFMPTTLLFHLFYLFIVESGCPLGRIDERSGRHVEEVWTKPGNSERWSINQAQAMAEVTPIEAEPFSLPDI